MGHRARLLSSSPDVLEAPSVTATEAGAPPAGRAGVPPTLLAALLAVAGAGALFLAEGRRGFTLGDEGFLWYGVQRVLAGEVPLRDFMAYDPARYYLSSVVVWLQGDAGIMPLRRTLALVHAATLFVALRLVLHAAPRRGATVVCAGLPILVAWHIAPHKAFDVAAAVALAAVLTLLAERPSVRRVVLAGLAVGLVAVLGRNHGLYGGAAAAGVVVYAGRGGGPRRVLGWLGALGAGVVAGYLPLLAMLAGVPGFARAFWDGIRFSVERGATNLTLPVPWPWRAPFGTALARDVVQAVTAGTGFVAVVAFAVAAPVWVAVRAMRGRPVPAAVVASAALAPGYAHYTLSRADVPHLALGVWPLLLTLLVVVARRADPVRWAALGAAGGFSLVLLLPWHPAYGCRTPGICTWVEVDGERLQAPVPAAEQVTLLRRLAAEYAPRGESFVATPLVPGAYALLDRRSPMWAIYGLWPRGEAFEAEELRRVRAADPAFVLVVDFPLDGRDDRRFAAVHPQLDAWFRSELEPLPSGLGPVYRVYRRPGGGTAAGG